MEPATPTISGFECVSLLGRGGMGEVGKARQQGIGRWVAIKVLHPQFSQDEEYVQRFLREARTVGKLSHENIVRAFDCGQAGGRNYLVMEFIEGRPLDRLLEERRVIPEHEALLLVRPIAEALQHAWDHRIIHRDIKPQNILISTDGIPKLCDLGLSRDVSESTRLTMTGMLACTPAYASPEQANGEKTIDIRTDLYSLGVMLYELVTGKLPFESASPAALLVKHVTEAPVAPISLNPRLSAGTNRLILDLLEKLPSKRPGTPAAVVSRIDGLLQGKEAPAPKTSRLAEPRRRHAVGQRSSSGPILAIAGGVGALLLVILVVALSTETPPPRPPAQRPPEPVARPTPAPAPTNTGPSAPIPATESRAGAALLALRNFRAAHPDDLPAQIRETEKTLPDLAGSSHFEETRRELDSLRSRRADALARARAELDTKVKAAVAKEEFRTAILTWKAATARHPDAPWTSEEGARIAEIEKAADAVYSSLATSTAEAVRKGDPTALETLRKRIAAWGMPELSRRFDQLVAANAPAPKPPAAVPPAPVPAPPPPAAPAGRPKAPATAERAKIRARVRTLFKEDYSKTTFEEARALATKLLEAARRPETDAASRYVFLEEARDQAARGGSANLAFNAVEGIVAEFDVDARREWSDALGKLRTAAREPALARAFVTACLDRAAAAIRGDEYDLAGELLKAGETAVGRSDDSAALAASLLKVSNDVQRARYGHRLIQKDLEKLKANPEDPEANLAVGRFLCLVKGDWPRSFEHLIKGPDKTLQEAANRERAAGADVSKLADAADAWILAAGPREPDPFREHALDLYQGAWPSLAGERRDRVREVFLKTRRHEGVVKDAAPAGWYIGKGTRRELFRVDGTRSRTGTSCLRVDAGEPKGWMSIGHFPTLEGKEYEFSAWVLSDQGPEWDLCTVYFYPDPAKPPVTGMHLRVSGDQPWWTLVRTRFKVPPGSKSIQVMVTNGFPKGTLWVDDLSLRALDSGEQIVTNGSFER